ncbi:hypothetical protein IPM65_00450 [Candidatus Roizmanbacteria bacterium]|nr:MAG: hypothetical protein IPM65_00450 [Candidatus Roizmanbacteria bacterium]
MAKTKKTTQKPQEESFSLYSLLNPTIIAVSAIALLLTSIAVTSVFRNKNTDTVEESVPAEQILVLPEGWEKVTKEGYENTYIKKQVEAAEYTPTVAYDRNTVKETTAGEYFSTMIAGAKSAIPSLVVTSNEEHKYDGYDVLNLAGNYYQGGNHIQIRQRLLLKGTTLHTIAASYVEGQEISEEEIDALFDYIVHNYIK